MRKVKFACELFKDKLSNMLTNFPNLTEIHPMYADLINVL